jgi:hypothetical protein
MTARQIAERMLEAKGVSGVAPKAVRDLATGVLASLQNNEGKTVKRVGEGLPMRWHII